MEGGRGHETSIVNLSKLAQARMPTWHPQAAVPLNFSKTTGGGITIRATAGSVLTFQGVLLV
jgi:hypothetical protein